MPPGGLSPPTYDLVVQDAPTLNLWWSDPLGGSANDYDLFVLSKDGTAVVASSRNPQTGTIIV